MKEPFARPLILLLSSLLLLACGRFAPPAETGFVDRSADCGIDFVNHTGRARNKRYIVEAKGGGILSLDYDGDGRLDLYVVDGNMYRLDPDGNVLTRTANPEAGNRLYRNLGSWRFEDVTEKAGVGDRSFGFGGGVGDYDGDGRPDIYVCNWGRNVLYHNDGDGSFTDVTAEAGVGGDDGEYSTGATFFDGDGDGDLDLYVANYADMESYMKLTKGRGLVPNGFGIMVVAGPSPIPPQLDRYYRNDGDGTFTDESATALRNQQAGYSFTGVSLDANRDGHADLYVTSDMTSNPLWMNDGAGQFDDRGTETGTALSGWGGVQAGMGNDSVDYDQDGWPDLFTTNYLRDRNTLYRNLTGKLGRLYFQDVTIQTGLGRADNMKVCWATKAGDFDLDGYMDLFVVAGHFYDTDAYITEEGAGYRQLPSLWFGEGPPDWGFRLSTPEERGPGMTIPIVGRGASFGDFDDDGDIDVIVSVLNDRPLVLENRVPRRGAWLSLRLVGRAPNRDAIGARATVSVKKSGLRQEQEVRRSASFLSANDPRLFFGVGRAATVDRLAVVWPDGTRQEFSGLAANAAFRLEQGGEPVREGPEGSAR